MRTPSHNTAVVTSDARYRALVDILTEFVLVTNSDGMVVTPEESWANYTGLADDTTAGRGWLCAVHPDDRDAFEKDWAHATAAGTPFAIAGRLLHHSGEHRHCVGRVAPVPDERG